MPGLACEIPFMLASLFFWHILVILCAIPNLLAQGNVHRSSNSSLPPSLGMGWLSKGPWFLWVENSRKLLASLLMDIDRNYITHLCTHVVPTCTSQGLTDTFDSHPGFFQTWALSSFSDIYWLTPCSPWPFCPPPYTNAFLEWALKYMVGTPLCSSSAPRHCQISFSPLQSAQWFFAWEGWREESCVFKVEFDVLYVAPKVGFSFLMNASKGAHSLVSPKLCHASVLVNKNVWRCSIMVALSSETSVIGHLHHHILGSLLMPSIWLHDLSLQFKIYPVVSSNLRYNDSE